MIREAVTKGIKISVNTLFNGLQERNNRSHYLFSYYITIENMSEDTVQLFSRRWNIYDSLNETEIVEGEGVIGQQPVLEPGQKHTYRSHCILLSNCGSMAGYYNMLNLDEETSFRVKIPTFQLNTQAILN